MIKLTAMEVVSVEYLRTTTDDEYVYDLETEDGTYVAGRNVEDEESGGIVVKNTDSCYVQFLIDVQKFKNSDGELNELEYMKEQFKVAEECAKYISGHFKAPIKLEFEKIMFPFFLFKKKRYAYKEWTDPSGPHDKIEYKGLSTVRRDYCAYVKTVVNTLFEILMNNRKGKNSIEQALQYVLNSINDLFNDKVPLSQLEISKQLKDKYKCSGKEIRWYNGICTVHENEKEQIDIGCGGCEQCLKGGRACKQCRDNFETIKMPHVFLARKMRMRNPITGPKPPERVPYIFILAKNAVHQCDKVASPEDFAENKKLKVDALYYFEHQLREPILQVFELLIEEHDSMFDEIVQKKRNKDNNQGQITDFFRPQTTTLVVAEKKMKFKKIVTLE